MVYMSTASETSASSPQDSRSGEIEDAFRALPPRLSYATGAIPYDVLIPGIGRQLMHMAPVPPPKIRAPKSGLKALEKATSSTIKGLLDLHPTACDVLELKPEALRQITSQLRILHVAIKKAVVPRIKGAPVKVHPAKIARVVADHYCGITGENPTVPKKDGKAYGPFLALMTDVFRILGVRASPLSQAEKIARNWPKSAD
jgi:hypothetical protein